MTHTAAAPEMDARAEEIREEFSWLDDWEARYQHIIDLGKAMDALPEERRTDALKVRGCASQVWMDADVGEDGRLSLEAASDAAIVSGLIALLARLYRGAPAGEAARFPVEAFLDEVGVSGALTAQRSNGLASMVRRLRDTAAAPA